MPASLSGCRNKLLRRLSLVATEVDNYHTKIASFPKLHRWAAQEGFLSSVWQLWNGFTRELLLSSCRGATTLSGLPVTSPYATLLEPEIAYLAREYSLGNAPKAIKGLKSTRLEPTWGDVGKVQKIVAGLSTTNAGTLATGFGAAQLIRDVQDVRNASAHLTAENRLKIAAMKVRYDKPLWAHPSDAMFWIDPASQDFAWRAWIDEMEAISLLVVQ